jgi:RNA 3'-terminal phosphate cyclase (ATP)
MLVLDGSAGEGGGQILRTALGLSLATGRPFRIENIRARRSKPGLRYQHRMAVKAAQSMSDASIEGAKVGSRCLEFHPGAVRPGHYSFDIGTAGSTSLVFQAVLPALMTAPGPSSVSLIGGTHNPMAPPFEFLTQVYFPVLRRMGVRVEAALERVGFAPGGGGAVRFSVTPAQRLVALDHARRGAFRACRGRALIAGLPRSIADRQLATLRRHLTSGARLEIEELEGLQGVGNAVLVELEFAHQSELFVGFGERGRRAEEVAESAAREAEAYRAAAAPVGALLADQLLIPLALSGGGSFVTVDRLSLHSTTNMATIEAFLDVTFQAERVADGIRVCLAS